VDPYARTIETFALDGTAYRLTARGSAGDEVSSRVLPGFTVPVALVCPA
jgi:hypothetical protein